MLMPPLSRRLLPLIFLTITVFFLISCLSGPLGPRKPTPTTTSSTTPPVSSWVRTHPHVSGSAKLRLAYLILVHSHDSVLAAQRLLPAIYHPDFYYVIVVDQNMDHRARRALDDFLSSQKDHHKNNEKDNNVKVVRANVRSEWGSLGLVQNELDGLQELLAFGPWDYAINLSGDSYPLVSQARLVERLAYWRGANFVVDGGERPERANEVPAFKAERLAVVKSWPTGVTQPDQFGSQWFVLTREFVEYALTSAFARNVLVAMAADKAQIPDESYFQVLLMNSPFNITVSQRPATAPAAPAVKPICRYLRWHSKCLYSKPGARPLPCFFGPKDFEALVESDCVFTRKMHPEVSGDLYAMLDQHISTQ